MTFRTLRAASAATALLTLVACSSTSTSSSGGTDDPATGTGHGAVAGAAEVAEPQLHLVSVDRTGAVSMLDLLSDTRTDLGTVDAPDSVTSDGRYVFAANASGVDVVDSGVWTWDHTDHFHYYRSQPRTIGRVRGAGTATISTGMLSTAGSTGVFFPDSGEAVLLDNAALSRGDIESSLRMDVAPHDGLVAPLGDGAVVTEPDEQGRVQSLRVVDAGGEEIGRTECRQASGTITTRIGLVVGCADGAVLASIDRDGDSDQPVLEHIAYPSDVDAAPATSFDARKGRPTVAGLGDGTGVWLLDTRERSWTFVETTTPIVAASAVDDAATHVVAIGDDGTVQVYDGSTARQTAVTEPILTSTMQDPDLARGLTLTVDAQRAYVNAAADGVVHEIDYADGARLARALTLSTQPVHVAETGR
jgi:hypothetical protein